MKKIVLRNGRTMRCPTFLLCIAGVLLAVGVLAAYMQSKDIDVYTEKDTLVSAYINYLSKASSARAARENMNFLCESPGMGTLSMGSSMIDLDEAEQSGYLFRWPEMILLRKKRRLSTVHQLQCSSMI